MRKKYLLNKINRLITYARCNCAYYRKLFQRIKLPKEISDISQFESIPVTFREQLARNNDEFIAVTKNMWTDVATTSGTSGKAIYIPFTKEDMRKNAYFIAKKFSIFGLRADDTAYITTPVDQSMWIGGLSVWLGCLKINACCVRAGNVGMDKHMEFMERFKPTVIFGLPSFILKLGQEAKKRSLDIPWPRLIVSFGENVMNRDFSRNALGKAIEKLWGAKIISGYCSTEASPGFECIHQMGHHVLPEMMYVEIVDPKTLKVLGPRQEGLVVVTHFGREGLPLIRYANGDISFLEKARCACARATPRLGPVIARIDEMAKIKGVNIFPSQIVDYLSCLPVIKDFRIKLVTAKNSCDNIKIEVEFKRGLTPVEKRNKLNCIQQKLKDVSGIKFDTREKHISRSEEHLKAKKSYIVDRRKKDIS